MTEPQAVNLGRRVFTSGVAACCRRARPVLDRQSRERGAGGGAHTGRLTDIDKNPASNFIALSGRSQSDRRHDRGSA